MPFLLCECGCGEIVRPGNRFVLGHYSKTSKFKSEMSGNKNPMRRPENRVKISKARKGKCFTEEHKKKLSESKKKYLKEHPEKHQMKRPDVAKRMGESLKKYFIRHPKAFRRFQRSSRNGKKFTKPERRLRRGLNKLFPNEYKYVGNHSVLIGFKNPDFINVNGQKKIIEMFGNYWHGKEQTGRTKEEEEQQRIKHFARYGYRTLIVWESELKNIPRLKKKLVQFHNEGEIMAGGKSRKSGGVSKALINRILRGSKRGKACGKSKAKNRGSGFGLLSEDSRAGQSPT